MTVRTQERINWLVGRIFVFFAWVRMGFKMCFHCALGQTMVVFYLFGMTGNYD